MTESARTSSGRGWAYLGTLLGGAVSIAANIAHSFVAPAGAAAGWRPPTGAILLAAFWPVSLFVAIEILARVAWRRGWRMIVLRFGGLVPVAGTAAIVSYMHLSGLLGHYGEPRVTMLIGPLAVDGLMVMSAAALMSTSPQHPATAPETVSEPVLAAVPETGPETPPEQPEKRTPRPRSRTAKKTARKTAAPKRTEAELLEAASALNETALATTGEPVSLRRLKTELRIGQDNAVKLRDAVIVTAPEPASPAVLEHANGTSLATAAEGI